MNEEEDPAIIMEDLEIFHAADQGAEAVQGVVHHPHPGDAEKEAR